jgi:hypothetical protein
MPRCYGQNSSAGEQSKIRALSSVICTSLQGSKGFLPALSETVLPESRKKPEVRADRSTSRKMKTERTTRYRSIVPQPARAGDWNSIVDDFHWHMEILPQIAVSRDSNGRPAVSTIPCAPKLLLDVSRLLQTLTNVRGCETTNNN